MTHGEDGPARLMMQEEVRQVLDQTRGTPRLMAALLYGAGLRLLECARLRVKDVDFGANQIRSAPARAIEIE